MNRHFPASNISQPMGCSFKVVVQWFSCCDVNVCVWTAVVCLCHCCTEHSGGGSKYSRTMWTYDRSAGLRQSLRQHDLQDFTGISRELSASISRSLCLDLSLCSRIYYLRWNQELCSWPYPSFVCLPVCKQEYTKVPIPVLWNLVGS